MKNSLLLLLFFCPIVLAAQNSPDYFKVFPRHTENLPDWAQLMYSEDPVVFQVDFLFEKYFEKTPFQKSLHTQNYKYWRRMVAPWIDAAGLIRKPSKTVQDKYVAELQARETLKSGNLWSSMGPVETYENGSLEPISWQVNVYCLDQSLTDPSTLFVGTEVGGVFKSTDHGQTWQLTSQSAPFSTVQDVKIDPQDASVVYVGANERVYRSTNGGGTWQELFFTDANIHQIRIHPTNSQQLFCATSNELYKSEDGGMTWNGLLSSRCWDVQYHPTNPGIVYALSSNGNNTQTLFLKSINGGQTWTVKDLGWYVPENPNEAEEFGGKIAVTPTAPDLIYAGLIGNSKAGDQGWIGVYRSTDVGESWILPSGQIGGPYPNNYCPASYNDGYHQGFYNFDVEVSDEDPGIIWVGTIRLNESADSAQTFQAIGAANSQRLDRIHADIQDIEVHGNQIWVASDGGINYSEDLLQSHESRKFGIIGSDFWGFGSGWNEDVLVGGKYHNGNGMYYQAFNLGDYAHVGGVEEATGYVHPIDNRKGYFSQGWTNSTVVREVAPVLGQPYVDHSPLPLFPNESYVESTSSGIYFDVRYADHLYMGSGNSFWKSTNGGASFEALYTFGSTGKVLEIVQSRLNPDHFYCVFQPGGGYWDPCDIYRSTDGGATWTQTTDLPADTWRLEIALAPDTDVLWASANRGTNGNKVFASEDGGESWINRTTPTLDGVRPKDIFCQGGNDGLTYLATNTAVYYWQQELADWQLYADGLPMIVSALEMRPFYRDAQLRLATYGRGIWTAPLAGPVLPMAQPITYTDTLFCATDTVDFDCFSILNHEGATWNWSFEPAPVYISDANVRNPKVVFGGAGSYDVTLTITDGSGQQSTKTIPNMVTVPGSCAPDSIPGLALTLPGQQPDYAVLEALNLNSNTLTISAWIKPNGIQNDFAGVVFSRGGSTTAGLNFRSGNELGYHWDDSQWWWSSGAIVPDGEWSHVALVIEPNQATIYLNGIPHLNTANHPVETFDGAIHLGADPNWADRRFRGEMDEVCIWNRALSQEEIRLLRHLTKERIANPDLPVYDPDLVGYYQFNEGGSRVINRVGTAHGQIAGAASTTPSDAPVGKGVSANLTITEGGIYTFGETGLEAAFQDVGIYPNGEWVATRIDLLPNLLPNVFQSTDAYWIINNYGAASFTSPVDIRVQPGVPGPSVEAVDNPSIVQLHTRQANAHQPNWFTNCLANDAQAGEDGFFQFGESCDFNGTGQQLFVTADDTGTVILGQTTNSTDFAPTGELRLYPNPVAADGTLYLQYTGGAAISWELYDAAGRLVQQHNFTDAAEIQVHGLSSGLYFYWIKTERQMYSGKVMVR